MKLRVQLSLAFGGMTLLLSLLSGSAAGLLAERQLKQNIGQKLASFAAYMSYGLEQDMFERYREMQTLSRVKTFRDQRVPESERQAFLEELQANFPSYSWIGFVNPEGIVQVSTNDLLEGESVIDRPWFTAALSQPYVGDVHPAIRLAGLLPESKLGPVYFVDVATPVRDRQNRLIGVLAAHLNWKWAEEVEQTLFDLPNAAGKDVWVLTQDGQVILGAPLETKSDLSSLSSFAAVNMGAQSGYRIERWPDGKRYLTGFFQGAGNHDYPDLGWVVLVRQEVDEAFAPARHLRQQIILGGVFLGGLFAFCGWLLADQIIRPILTVAAAANQIRQGIPGIRIPETEGNYEMAKLAQTLNQLISDVTTGEQEIREANQQLQTQLAISEHNAQALRRSEEQLRQIADNINDALMLKSSTTNEPIYSNLGYARLHDCGEEAFCSDFQAWLERVHPDDREQLVYRLQAGADASNFFDDEYRLLKADGSFRWVWDRSFPIRDETGKIYRRVVIQRDITDRKYAEEVFKTLTEITAPLTGQELFLTLAQYLSKVLNVEHVLISEYRQNQCQTLAFYSYGVLQPNRVYSAAIEPCDRLAQHPMVYYRQAVAQAFPAIRELVDADIQGFLGITLETATNQNLGQLYILSDRPLAERSRYKTVLRVFASRAAAEIERQHIVEKLKYDATHDALTGLPNRNLLMERLASVIERAQRDVNFRYAVLVIDLDRFKVINDSLGPVFGDQLLVQAAQRLCQLLGPTDLAVKLGGDEFLLLLTDVPETTTPVGVTHQLFDILKQPFTIDGYTIGITASVGIVIGTSEYQHSSDLLRDANIAMYRAKAKGKAQHAIFNVAMHNQAARKLALEQAIQQGLERQEFSLRYQPIVSLKTLQLVGFEALVRWEHPTQGMISPAEFVPAAEETGLIVPLGRWVLETACRQIAAWQAQFIQAEHLKVSVNLSALQLQEANLVEQVVQILEQTGVSGDNLALEITESMVMTDVEEISLLLARFRDYGIQISIDDFGTGFSSLNYLHRLPANNLKIDRSFVSQMSDSHKNQQIAATIVALADQLGMNAIAEGIETAAQLQQLLQFQCELGQGYWFAPPLTVAEATARIQQE